jgi:hypothetical protein
MEGGRKTNDFDPLLAIDSLGHFRKVYVFFGGHLSASLTSMTVSYHSPSASWTAPRTEQMKWEDNER